MQTYSGSWRKAYQLVWDIVVHVINTLPKRPCFNGICHVLNVGDVCHIIHGKSGETLHVKTGDIKQRQ